MREIKNKLAQAKNSNTNSTGESELFRIISIGGRLDLV